MSNDSESSLVAMAFIVVITVITGLVITIFKLL
jgi:hypothetical protein